MRITAQILDGAILSELGNRLAQIRLGRNLKQSDLAIQAGVSKRTVERMEAGGPTQLVNMVRICRALGMLEHFETLLPEPLASPVAQLKLRDKRRKRAASAKAPEPAGAWHWADTT